MNVQKIIVIQPDGTEKEMEVAFMDGCFDGLLEDGITEEELEKIKLEILEEFSSGRAFEEGTLIEDEEWEQIQRKIQTRQ